MSISKQATNKTDTVKSNYRHFRVMREKAKRNFLLILLDFQRKTILRNNIAHWNINIESTVQTMCATITEGPSEQNLHRSKVSESCDLDWLLKRTKFVLKAPLVG